MTTGTPGSPQGDARDAGTIVRLHEVSKRFVKRRSWGELVRRPFRREFVTALSSISIDIRRGEFFGFLGQNGAGKTTLFKTLATLVLPDSGSATVAGLDVVTDAARVRGVLTPVIAEERSLFWRLSALENLRLFAALYGLRGRDAERRAAEVLDIVSLNDTGEKLVGAFSSGMKQRLLIGRALLAESQVLLLDEPTRSLDPLSARDFRRFLRHELVDAHGYTVLLATHNADEALDLCDRVSVLHKGKLLAVGTVDELVERAGCETYRLIAKPELGPTLDQLNAAGDVDGVSSATTDEEGWATFEMSVPGGADEASALLKRLVDTGVPVAGFERRDLALADLLERILTDAEHA